MRRNNRPYTSLKFGYGGAARIPKLDVDGTLIGQRPNWAVAVLEGETTDADPVVI